MPILKKHTKSKLSTVHKFSRNLLLMSMFSLPMIGQATTPEPVGGEFTINIPSEYPVANPTITRLENGNRLVSWADNADNMFSTHSLNAQLYTPDGFKSGSISQLSAANKGGKVVALDGGGFLTVSIQEEPKLEFVIQQFDNNANPIGTEQRFDIFNGQYNDVGAPHRYYRLSQLPNNKVAVAFVSSSQNSEKNIFTSIIDANENIAIESTHLVASSVNISAGLQITTLQDGNFAILWTSKEHSNVKSHVQSFNNQGIPVSNAITVDYVDVFLDGEYPGTLATTNDGFLVVLPSKTGPVAYSYTSDGQLKGSKIEVYLSEFETTAQNFATTTLKDGRIIITFMTNKGLQAQALNQDGTKSGEVFTISASMVDMHMHNWVFPNIDELADGYLFVTWVYTHYVNRSYVNDVRGQLLKVDTKLVNGVTATLPTRPIFAGNIFDIPLSIEGTNVYGVDAVLSINGTQVAQFSDGLYGEFLPSYERLTIPVNVTGERWESALSLKSPYKAKTGKGHFGTASLIATNPGTVTVTVQSQFTDENGQYIYQSQDNYTLTVLESVLISGSVASLAPDGDFSNFTITINGEIVKINPDGSFSVQAGIGEATLTFSAPGYLSKEQNITLSPNQANVDLGEIDLVAGDSNGNDKIDIGDLTKLLGAYRTTSTDPNYSIGVDFNRDNKVDLQDLTLLGKNFGKQAQ
ncbi:hypothetical protein [Pseudoalteromonas luteoviolacea]|uniref:Dockerin domain-containing protein n=1 Tax=Pseudoalteromonas luteoviolacea S4054 TaxID=1129367 RepID=A0A0F6A6N5_9GAMM|nr:hypothetical protein [Pseudoalteromonas luteoviolacea]AOT10888.1 hypothetical protein S4054249_23885 [Pseudoalteromonas luteoviolacea]AOT15949.1 hypothetical protein S40542_24625 [Pseudoalteromonas luteoviolacea]AOT20709.1 hypothetical protein S4054_23805 [Pseudoalteromonas luteoviolacea]KKE81810.1 hypothetical protein N479_02290 [Pseudoalteromonas luteoviolacea S4054]KZN66232.1 hypothetical protein N481_24790 [Pseudoalteromonas luteoviolacea S4047-1]